MTRSQIHAGIALGTIAILAGVALLSPAVPPFLKRRARLPLSVGAFPH
ncbi:hypothetical protein [Reyranella sp.]|nr:hypothetical protein [Reyranella sp.]